MVVLKRAFWPQSMNTLLGRRLRFMIDTTWAGIRCSSSWATARAKPAAWSWVWGRLRGT